jgi:hypothetical protein
LYLQRFWCVHASPLCSGLDIGSWIGCYVETGVRPGKSRFRSEAKLGGRQAGIHQANTGLVLVFHFTAS